MMMDGMLPSDVCMIKIEPEETVVDQEFGNAYVEIELPNEYEVKQEHEIEDIQSELTDEELELPVPVTLPDHGADALEAEVLQDPLMDIPDSWIYIKDESDLHDYNPPEISPNSSFYCQSSQSLSYDIHGIRSDEDASQQILSQELLEDPLNTDPKQQWIEEAKQKVELHIQEVRRRRKLRDRDVSTESSSNKCKERNMIMVPSLVIVPRMQRVTDMPAMAKIPITPNRRRVTIKNPVTKKPPAPSIPKCNLKPRPRPAVTHGSEWDQWVLEEKARLEQHILEVRQSRKRRVEETPIHKNNTWHVIQTMPLESSQLGNKDNSSQASEIRSIRSIQQLEENIEGKGISRSKGRGRGKGKGGRPPKATTRIEETGDGCYSENVTAEGRSLLKIDGRIPKEKKRIIRLIT